MQEKTGSQENRKAEETTAVEVYSPVSRSETKEDVIKQLVSLMQQQGMQQHSQEFMEVLTEITYMKRQLDEVLRELGDLRRQLNLSRESESFWQGEKNQAQAGYKQVLRNTEKMQQGLMKGSEYLSAARSSLVNSAGQAINAFKEKGKKAMCSVLQKGISAAKSLLGKHRERMVETLNEYKKTAHQIDEIGGEMKQIGNSIGNIGRLMRGGEKKEVSTEKPGVALTRMLNAPVKRAIESVKKQIDKVDRTTQKLDRLSDRLANGKVIENSEKEEKPSVMGKLIQMKSEVDAQKQEPQKEEAQKQTGLMVSR